MDWSIVFKALTPLAGRAFASVAPSLFRTWLVAFEATKRAKKEGVQVKYFALRKVIDDYKIFEAFHKSSRENLDELLPAMQKCIRGGVTSELKKPVAVLLAFVADAYVHNLPPAQATRFESERTRDHVTSEVARLEEGRADERNFEANCKLLNPYRAQEARSLFPQWTLFPKAVASIVAAEDRKQLFEDWSVKKPTWLEDAPASVMCWLSFVALDFGASTAAQRLLEEGIAAGASPRSYWQARLVLIGNHSPDEAEKSLVEARDHPFAAALLANLHEDNQKALEHIRVWEPSTSEGKATKKLVTAQLLMATDELDCALQTAREGYEEFGSTGCGLYAAKLLLGRGSLRKHPAFMNDLAQGLQLATAVRASRRHWGGDSSEAVVVLIGAYRLMGSSDNALGVGTAAPEGVATPSEASDARVRVEMARTAAELGMTQRARELLTLIENGRDKEQIEASLVEAELGSGAAIPSWARMLTTATDPVDALNIGLRLAHNEQEVDWPLWIREGYAAELGDIDMISELFRSVPGSLQKARVRAATSRLVFHGLKSFLDKKARYSEAAEVAEAGGKRWSDPEAWLEAAGWHLKGNDRDRAVRAAEEAIRVGGTAWLGEGKARKLLVENRSAQGLWDKALVEATRVYEIEPDDDASKWAFLTCQYMTADYQGAWESLRRFRKLAPRTADNARMSVQLHSRFAPTMDFLDEAKKYAERWPNDEQLRATIAVSLLESHAKPETDVQVALYQNLMSGFMRDYPNSSAFHAITSEDKDPIESVRAQLLKQLESQESALEPILEQVAQPILRGELPVGTATELSGKSYAEICLIRGAGKVFAGDPYTIDEEIDVVLENLDRRVVVDTTALSTLSLLDPQAGKEWLGLFLSGVLPVEALHDLQNAAVNLSIRSTATIGIDKVSGTLRIAEVSKDEANRRAERAETMLAIGKQLESVSHPKIMQLTRMTAETPRFRWLLALDLAKTLNLAFWCDDKSLRGLARSSGVRSFGTPALLEALRGNGTLAPAYAEVFEAELVRGYYTGIRFSEPVLRLAAEMDKWMPLGVAAALTETGPETPPEKLLGFVLQALRQCTSNPEAIEAWVTVATTWLDSVSVDAESMTGNLRLWFSIILQQDWITASTLPFVLSGLRSGSSRKADLESVVPEVIGRYYSEVADQTDHATAALYVRDLIRLVPAPDKAAVLRRIITP